MIETGSAKAQYKLIFMDFSMPEMDGIESSKTIQLFFEQLGAPCPMICFLSAYQQESFIERAKQIGIEKYFFKPAQAHDLTKLLHELHLV